MPRYAAFLRGVTPMNLKMPELKAAFEAAGFTDAAIYDPPGVGGTGVVSVLAYGNSPGAYGLPSDPSVSFAVEIWKGPLKWVGNFAIVGGIIGTFIHYLRFGPKHAPAAEHKADAAGGGRQ